MTTEEYLSFEAELEHIQLVLWRNNVVDPIDEMEKIHHHVFLNIDSIARSDADSMIESYRTKSEVFEAQGK